MLTRKGFLKRALAIAGLGGVAASIVKPKPVDAAPLPKISSHFRTEEFKLPKLTATEAMYKATRKETCILDFTYCKYPIPDYKRGDRVYLDRYFMGIAKRWAVKGNALEIWKYRGPNLPYGVACFGWLWRDDECHRIVHLQPGKGA